MLLPVHRILLNRIFSTYCIRQSKQKPPVKKQLEEMAYVDSLTGGMSYTKFVFEAEKILKNNPDENYAFN